MTDISLGVVGVVVVEVGLLETDPAAVDALALEVVTEHKALVQVVGVPLRGQQAWWAVH